MEPRVSAGPSAATGAPGRARQAPRLELRRVGSFPVGPPVASVSERDLRRGADRAHEVRHDVEHALARAPLDVRIEAVPAEIAGAPARAETVERRREAVRETDRDGRGIRASAAE